ncbi:MAG: hypothetical protein HY318_06700 [Armatimonadetes bacterium]|nr:hypothetical protein [Armatimonadota bacterium]
MRASIDPKRQLAADSTAGQVCEELHHGALLLATGRTQTHQNAVRPAILLRLRGPYCDAL